MRGKVTKCLIGWRVMRITPAYAGKSSAFIRSSPVNQDHPRLCGEKMPAASCVLHRPGSPPPMRGKAGKLQPFDPSLRITPAYAGKSIFINTLFQLFKDHPRLCGEKLSGRTQQQRRRRITPAYAGKSRKPVHRRKPMQDHPRLCGEKAFLKTADTLKWGSPPPMRGKG